MSVKLEIEVDTTLRTSLSFYWIEVDKTLRTLHSICWDWGSCTPQKLQFFSDCWKNRLDKPQKPNFWCDTPSEKILRLKLIHTLRTSLSFCLPRLKLDTLYKVIHQNKNSRHARTRSCRLLGIIRHRHGDTIAFSLQLFIYSASRNR